MIKISSLLNLNIPLILASESPRRKKLLEQLGFEFMVQPSRIDEDNHTGLEPRAQAERLSLDKAMHIARQQSEESIVIGADTIVVLDEEALNKPSDESDAAGMLKKLSGRTHIVYTGIALVRYPDLKSMTSVQETEVTFRELGDDEIEAYVKSGSPLDKAGAYGIQDDFGAVFVSNIKGCYYNIVGLPLQMLYSSLKEFINAEA